MKIVKKIFLITTMITSLLMAEDATIFAVKVDVDLSKVSYRSSVWNDAIFSEIILYPQTAIKFNDERANELNMSNKAKKAEVASVYNGEKIAFMIRWSDNTMNIQENNKTTSYADGFAVQFASDYSKSKTLPYIGMGSNSRPVIVHLQKAVRSFFKPNGDGNVAMQINSNQTNFFNKDLQKYKNRVKKVGSNDYERTFISEGFRTMREIKDASDNSYARLSYKQNSWMGTLSRSMHDDYIDLHSSVIPVAFAIWDGEKIGRAGIKNLSQWLSVKLEGIDGNDNLITALSSEEIGDIMEGEKIVAMNNCVECHQIKANDPINSKGPNLTNVGGYSTVDYLRESLLKPSAVIIYGYNSNSKWYSKKDGKYISTMSDYSLLDDESINNVVAYLKTLKVEVE